MPYNCTLTDNNKSVCENNIVELIHLYYMQSSNTLLCFIIVLLVEYLFAYQYINTSELVTQEAAFRKARLSSSGIAVVSMMRRIRNNAIHSPWLISESTLRLFKERLTSEVITDLTWFYNDAEPVKAFLYDLHAETLELQYLNISLYKQRYGMTDDEFEIEKERLMSLLEASSVEELNSKIVDLLD